MRPTDQILARYIAEVEDRQKFIDGVVEDAEKENRDLSSQELELVTRARERLGDIQKQMGPLEELSRIGSDSANTLDRIHRQIDARNGNKPQEVEYRSAGQYALDMWRAGLGDEPAKTRLDLYRRAAAHQTTADNPGLIPTPIVGGVLNFIDAARPIVNALGPQQLPSWSFSRPKVTQHTAVAAQSAEKAELTSQKMTISKTAVTPSTIGGYLNLSRQDLDYTVPGILDIVINDLAAQYAILTEATAVQAFYSGGTAAGTGMTIDATPTADEVASSVWAAAAAVYTATKGQGRVLLAASPDVLGILGPLFAPVNPVDAQSTGFSASQFGQGAMGAIGGIPVYVTAGFAAAKSLMMLSTAAAEVYEDRIGSLQVVEPSVLGLQVAYAGNFATFIGQATGIQKITVT